MLLVGIKISYYSHSTLNSTPLEFHSRPGINNLVIRETNKVELPLGIHTHYKPQIRISTSHLQASPMGSTLEVEF